MLVTINHANLEKNKVSEAEVHQVLASETTIDCDLSPSRKGYNRIMLIGFTLAGRLLELGMEFLPDNLHIFHASNATKQYQKEFSRRMRS